MITMFETAKKIHCCYPGSKAI